MAVDATGAATSPDSIAKYLTSADAPSGKGFNAAMDSIQAALTNNYVRKTLLTTTGDIIYASGANTPARLAVGSTGQALVVAGGIPSWGSVGLKTTVGTLAAGPPGSPATNDIWIATDVDANGTVWVFRYNSAETTYKWEFIGGSPIITSVATSEATTSGTFVDLATVGPSFTATRAGDYIFDTSFQAAATATGGGNAQGIMFKNGTTNVGFIGSTNMANIPGLVNNVAWKQTFTGLTAADSFKLRYSISNGVNTSFGARFLMVTPIRII